METRRPLVRDDRNIDLQHQLKKLLKTYGSYDAMARFLRRHDMFYGLSRQTIWRWMRRAESSQSALLRRRIFFAIEILNAKNRNGNMPLPTKAEIAYTLEGLQLISQQMGNLRKEVRDLMKNLRILQTRSRRSRGG